MNFATRIVATVVCIALVGCTTLNPVPLVLGRSPPMVLNVDDHVRVRTHEGVELIARVVSTNADGLILKEAKSHRIQTLTWAQVETIEIERFSWWLAARNFGIGFLFLVAITFYGA